MRVDIEEPDYSGYETITLDVGGAIDINDYLEGSGWEWKPGVEDALDDEHASDALDAVYNALEYAGKGLIKAGIQLGRSEKIPFEKY